jgi:hypothetical protein
MKRIYVTEKMWNDSIAQFFYTPHLSGDKMLVKKLLIMTDFILNIYYFYIIETPNGIEKFSLKHPIYKTGIVFKFDLHMQPIPET